MAEHDDDLNPAKQAQLDSLDYSDDYDLVAVHSAIEREKLEPQEGDEPVNLVLMAFLAAILFYGGWYLGKYSGDFSSEIFDERQGGAIVAVAATAGGGGAAAAEKAFDPIAYGKRNYTANCAACHQASGMGAVGQYPPLAASEWVLEPNPKRIIKIVISGMQGEMTVKGVKYNNVMQPWGKVLSDKKIAAILTYIRQEWGNAAPPVTEAEVAAVRAESGARPNSWTEAELLAVSLDKPILDPAAAVAPPAN